MFDTNHNFAVARIEPNGLNQFERWIYYNAGGWEICQIFLGYIFVSMSQLLDLLEICHFISILW